MLMPPPFSQQHNQYLKNYMTTGVAKVLGAVRSVVAMHKERFVFPVALAVTKITHVSPLRPLGAPRSRSLRYPSPPDVPRSCSLVSFAFTTFGCYGRGAGRRPSRRREKGAPKGSLPSAWLSLASRTGRMASWRLSGQWRTTPGSQRST